VTTASAGTAAGAASLRAFRHRSKILSRGISTPCDELPNNTFT
jgi:hypothetical protein